MCGMTSVSIETLDIRGGAFTLLQGLKPQVELGSKTSVAPSTTAGAWKIDVAGAEDEDLIDDDDLLTEADRKPGVPKTGNLLMPPCVDKAVLERNCYFLAAEYQIRSASSDRIT